MIFRHRIKKILIPDHEPPRFANIAIELPRHQRVWPKLGWREWLQKRLGEIRKG